MLLQNIMKLLQKYGMNFLNGLGTTLLLALISVAIGCVIGAIVAILRLGKSKILKAIATVYTEVVRDTPLLLQLYFFYFLLPDIMPALKLSKFTCITIALVFNSRRIYGRGLPFRHSVHRPRLRRKPCPLSGSFLPPDHDPHHPAAGF